MSINKLIKDTLKPLNIPVKPHTYTGDESTYITFFEYLEQGEDFADDKEEVTGHYIQVDVWSKGNALKVSKEVKKKLIEVGFTRRSEFEDYEPDTKLFRRCIRFFYANEN